MRNQTVYRALREFCGEAVAELARTVPSAEDLPRVWATRVRATDSGFASERVQAVNWRTLIAANAVALEGTSSYLKAVQALKVEKPFASHFVVLMSPERIVSELLARVLEEGQELEFNGEAFDAIYQETEDYFYRSTVECTYLAALRGFRMEADIVELSPGFRLIRIPDEVREQMYLRASEQPAQYEAYMALATGEYGLEVCLELQKQHMGEGRLTRTGDWGIAVARTSIDKACSALRLFKSGEVGYRYIVVQPTSWTPFPGPEAYGPRPGPWIGTAYVLSEDEVKSFERFWKEYQDALAVPEEGLSVAVARFNRGYAGKRPEDRLVDYVVGFEALLMEEEQELRYRLALRGAALLGRNSDERELIREEIQKAYGQRNKIVHGEARKPSVDVLGGKLSFAELVERTENHLRSAITKCVMRQRTQTKKQMIKELERQIGRGFEHEDEH